jgi:hypothetical protein
MSRRFTFTQCITLLHTNSKTFLKWLAEDGIDASKQIDPADPRRKYVTEEQLISIAKKREIDLHLPILAGIDERFAKLEQQLVGRFDQLAAEIPTMLADLRHHLEQQLTHHFDQLDAHLAQMLAEPQRARTSAAPQGHPPTPAPRARIAAPAASAPSSPTATPPKPTAKKREKRKTKARKPLPASYVPLATFRQLHKISEKAVEIAIQKNRLAVQRGAWLYQHRSITVALDRQGQQQFHALFNERQNFQRCEQCPHALSRDKVGYLQSAEK